MADIRISQLPTAPAPIDGTELVPVVQNGLTVQTTVSAITQSPSLTATFLTVNQQPLLPNSRALSAGVGIGITDGGAQSTYNLSLNGTSGSLEGASTGVVVKSGANTIVSRSLTASGNGISVADGDGVAGNPTFQLTGLAAAIANMSGTGLIGLNSSTLTPLTIIGTANQISVLDGDGASGNPTLSIANDAIFPGNAGVTLPNGTTGQRGVVQGQIRYNTDTSRFEGLYSTGWQAFGVGDGSVTSVSGTTDQINVSNVGGIATVSLSSDPVIPGSGAVQIPSGTTAARPAAPVNGDLRYNTTTATFEGYANGVWGAIVTGSGVTSVATGTGLTGGPITSTGTISIANTTVAAAAYGSATQVPTYTVNAQGQLTAAANVSIAIPSSAITDKGLANGVATLDSGGKVPVSELPAAVLGALSYQGTWNASTNTPTLVSGVGTKGYYYVVDTAGSTNLDGVTDWKIGDWAVYNGTAWQKVDNTDSVTSVNGYTGAVVLTASDVGAQPAGTYVTSVGATSPVASSGGTTPTISMPAATGSVDGYLTSADWSTFNSKASAFTYTTNYIPYGQGTTTPAQSANLTFNGTTLTTTGNAIISDNSSNAALRITQTGSGNALLVEDSANPDATPFVVDASGRAVVGTTSALVYSSSLSINPNLQVNAAGAATAGISRFSANTAANSYLFLKSRGATIGTFDVVANGDTLGIIGFLGADGTDGIQAASIAAQVDGTPGTNDMPGRLVFSTTADGASSPTEAVRIDSAGRVGIGGTPGAGQTLAINKALTGGTAAYGIINSGVISTDVTSIVEYNRTRSFTSAGGTGLGSLSGYTYSQSTLNTAVTNQHGFRVESDVTGATNNYGFYSAIASGTGRWNFYANGTAANFLAGGVIINNNLGVGAAGSPSYGTSGQVLQSNGSGAAPTWVTPAGGVTLSNDTSTAANLYPTFANATTGSVSTIYTGDARLLYKPSTGEFQSTVLNASNGIVVNSATVSESYTIPSGSNAISAGPVTVASGITVTISSGSVWVIA